MKKDWEKVVSVERNKWMEGSIEDKQPVDTNLIQKRKKGLNQFNHHNLVRTF